MMQRVRSKSSAPLALASEQVTDPGCLLVQPTTRPCPATVCPKGSAMTHA